MADLERPDVPKKQEQTSKPRKPRKPRKVGRIRQPNERSMERFSTDVDYLMNNLTVSETKKYFFKLSEHVNDELTWLQETVGEKSKVRFVNNLVDTLYSKTKRRLTRQSTTVPYVQVEPVEDPTIKQYVFELTTEQRAKIKTMKDFYGFNSDPDFLSAVIDQYFKAMHEK